MSSIHSTLCSRFDVFVLSKVCLKRWTWLENVKGNLNSTEVLIFCCGTLQNKTKLSSIVESDFKDLHFVCLIQMFLRQMCSLKTEFLKSNWCVSEDALPDVSVFLIWTESKMKQQV